MRFALFCCLCGPLVAAASPAIGLGMLAYGLAHCAWTLLRPL